MANVQKGRIKMERFHVFCCEVKLSDMASPYVMHGLDGYHFYVQSYILLACFITNPE